MGSVQSIAKTTESWMKNTLKKAIHVVVGGSVQETPAKNQFKVATHLTKSVLCASMPILPSDSRQESAGKSGAQPASNVGPKATFVVPKIQISFWNSSLGFIPPPPSAAAPKSLPQERHPLADSHVTKPVNPQPPVRSKSLVN